MFSGNMQIRESHAFFLNMPVFLSSCYSTCLSLHLKMNILLLAVFFLLWWYRCHGADRHLVMLNLVLRKGVSRQTIIAAKVGLPCSYIAFSTMSTSQSTCNHLQSNLIKHTHVFLSTKSKQCIYNGYIINFNKKLQTVKDEVPTTRWTQWYVVCA